MAIEFAMNDLASPPDLLWLLVCWQSWKMIVSCKYESSSAVCVYMYLRATGKGGSWHVLVYVGAQ